MVFFLNIFFYFQNSFPQKIKSENYWTFMQSVIRLNDSKIMLLKTEWGMGNREWGMGNEK